MTILERILQTKRAEIAAAQSRTPLAKLQAAAAILPPPLDFFSAVTQPSPRRIQLIAEVKKASPSAGVIVEHFDPVRIARAYAAHGAAALSVLTDETYFQGRLSYITDIRQAVSLPILRKDFIVDEYQVYETRAAGADAILLIVAALASPLTKRGGGGGPGAEFALPCLHNAARDLKLTILVEVHTDAELETVLTTLGLPGRDTYLLGVNNRDLHTQRTDLATTERLGQALPAGAPFISESGFAARADVVRAQRAGAAAILVGESLLTAADLGVAVEGLLTDP